MAIKYSELELAINTMVTEFYKAADDGPTMNATQFQTFASKQMPLIAKTVESEEGLGHVLQQMGVTSSENISFDDVWTLINKQAVQVFKNMPPEKGVKCNCLLQ